MSDGQPNEVQIEMEIPIPVPNVRGVILREFVWLLRPLRQLRGEQFASAEEYEAAVEGIPVDGLELLATARDTGLTVSLRLERGEFVNIATAGLSMLDAADATEIPEGGETL